MIALPAAVRFGTARHALEQALAQAEPRLASSGAEPLAVDLAATRDYDSSLIALMVALTRRASAAGRGVRFDGADPGLRQLAALYGVDALLFSPASASPASAATP